MLRDARWPPEGKFGHRTARSVVTAQTDDVETLPLRVSYHKFSRDVKWATREQWQTGNLL
jgi:hypothetical protein